MALRRERDSKREEVWSGRRAYYERCEKQNAKYDEWTSPRYHAEHADMLTRMREKREREETLTARREKLRKLLRDEETVYDIEMMMSRGKNKKNSNCCKQGDVPTEVLRSLNVQLKVEEEDRRRHDAEMALYHRWRSQNPVLQHCERMCRARDVKLSWLDQQIEARMRKEREEQENRDRLRECERRAEEARLAEEVCRKEREEKRQRLRADLDRQMAELKEKSRLGDVLKREEEEERRRQREVDEVIEKRDEEMKRRMALETVLCNVKQYKMRLKKKGDAVEAALQEDRELVERLRELNVIERIEDEVKRNELKQTLDEFLKINRDQRELEKCRRKYMDFIFDSEAKLRYEQQDEIWRGEENARAALLKDVLNTVGQQIDANVRRNREKQEEIVREREEMIRGIERYQDDMRLLREEEARRKQETKKRIDEEVDVKRTKRREVENREMRKIDEELERVRIEEERLKREILNIQKRQGPIRPQRSKIFL